MGDSIFGGLGGLLGQGLPQQFGQQQLQQGSFGPCNTGNIITGNVFTADSTATITFEPQHQVVEKVETAVGWLNRRVEEMRVRL